MNENKKVSKEERIISAMLTISIVIIALTGIILTRMFNSADANAVIGIFSIIALGCIVSVWIAVTISLFKIKKGDH